MFTKESEEAFNLANDSKSGMRNHRLKKLCNSSPNVPLYLCIPTISLIHETHSPFRCGTRQSHTPFSIIIIIIIMNLTDEKEREKKNHPKPIPPYDQPPSQPPNPLQTSHQDSFQSGLPTRSPPPFRSCQQRATHQYVPHASLPRNLW